MELRGAELGRGGQRLARLRAHAVDELFGEAAHSCGRKAHEGAGELAGTDIEGGHK
mgnify:CR=1 FL=1